MHSDGPALKTIAGQRSRCKAAADAPKLRYANSHRLLIPWMVKALHSNQRGPPSRVLCGTVGILILDWSSRMLFPQMFLSKSSSI